MKNHDGSITDHLIPVDRIVEKEHPAIEVAGKQKRLDQFEDAKAEVGNDGKHDDDGHGTQHRAKGAGRETGEQESQARNHPHADDAIGEGSKKSPEHIGLAENVDGVDEHDHIASWIEYPADAQTQQHQKDDQHSCVNLRCDVLGRNQTKTADWSGEQKPEGASSCFARQHITGDDGHQDWDVNPKAVEDDVANGVHIDQIALKNKYIRQVLHQQIEQLAALGIHARVNDQNNEQDGAKSNIGKSAPEQLTEFQFYESVHHVTCRK